MLVINDCCAARYAAARDKLGLDDAGVRDRVAGRSAVREHIKDKGPSTDAVGGSEGDGGGIAALAAGGPREEVGTEHGCGAGSADEGNGHVDTTSHDVATNGRQMASSNDDFGGPEATRIVRLIAESCITQATTAVVSRIAGGATLALMCAERLAEIDCGFVAFLFCCVFVLSLLFVRCIHCDTLP